MIERRQRRAEKSGFSGFDQRVLAAGALAAEIVVIDRPEHDPAEIVVDYVLGLRHKNSFLVRFALMELMVKYLFSGHVFVVVTDPFDAVVSKRTDGFRVGFLDGPVLHSNLLADLVIGQIALLSGGFAWFGRAVSWAAQLGQIGVGQFVGSSVGRDAQDELVGRCSVEQVNLNGGVLNFVLK